MKRCWLIGLALLATGAFAAGQITGASLTPDKPTGQRVGTGVLWTATAEAATELQYRFSVGYAGAAPRMVRDWGKTQTLEWTPIEEGDYSVRVSIRLKANPGVTQQVEVPFRAVSRLAGGEPQVSLTPNVLVALYSAPPQPEGSTLHVEFRREGAAEWLRTPEVSTLPGRSANVYVAGMRMDSRYEFRHASTLQGATAYSSPISLKTGRPDVQFPLFTVVAGPDAQTSTLDRFHFFSSFPPDSMPIPLATDMEGEVVWYLHKFKDAIHIVTNTVAGGTVLYIKGDEENVQGQFLVELDLAGNLVRETSAGRVNEQLRAMGMPLIGAFDHEAVRFPNGYTVVQVSLEQVFPAAALWADAAPTRDVLGSVILALDGEWRVVWAWNSFDHLDIGRHPNPSEVCGDGTPGCPPLFKASVAEDWIHGNAIAPSPVDGHLIYSSRAQDWVMKIDYADGAGTGDIIWRLGKDGDFTAVSGDPYPWNSHQHGAIYNGFDRVSLFDNGNTRCKGQTDCPSRCQVWQLDEKTRSAKLLVNAPVGYSMALGYSHMLANGNYHATSGAQGGQPFFGEAVEVGPDGAVRYALRGMCMIYRSCRLQSMYHAVPRSPVWGDLDGDGLRTATDFALMSNYLACNATRIPMGEQSADLDGDGRATASDLLRLSVPFIWAKHSD